MEGWSGLEEGGDASRGKGPNAASGLSNEGEVVATWRAVVTVLNVGLRAVIAGPQIMSQLVTGELCRH